MARIGAIIILITVLSPLSIIANEGMWLLNMIKQQNIAQMQSMGLKLSDEDIYSINQSCLKDAVVWFGGGCTGEIISDEGLLLTNHHCGLSAIQSHSSVEKDYLKNGFWAMQRAEEIPSPSLSVVFVRQIQDVSKRVMPANIDQLSQKNRLHTIDSLKQIVIKQMRDSLNMDVEIRPFFSGNQYIMFATEKYRDIRFVGAPPSAIGKFGGDTDNWIWPRHTADFALFRIYADGNGKPAHFSQKNVPYKPKHTLPISLKGYREGDFAMTIGFPGLTDRYSTSWGVLERMNAANNARILVRDAKQKIWMARMQENEKIRIQYASKYYSSSNYYKNSIGMNRGLNNLNVIQRKQALEKRFEQWTKSDTLLVQKYGNTLPLLSQNFTARTPITRNIQFFNEAFLGGVEIYNFASNSFALIQALEKEDSTCIKRQIKGLRKTAESFFKNYDAGTDQQVLVAMMNIFAQNIENQYHPSFLRLANQPNRSFEKYAHKLYENSIFSNQERMNKFLDKPSLKKLKRDPAVVGYNQIKAITDNLYQKNDTLSTNIAIGKRLFEAGLQQMEREKLFYPDANSTMRMSFGTVGGYSPRDGVKYNHYTTLQGVIEKEDTANFEYEVPAKLKQLYNSSDYGIYADADGLMRTCFITNNDITGGNSGSPVINGDGELIGIAFDGNIEALSGDIIYETDLKKCINVDIRYVLFLIDKFAGAHHLIEEMNIR